MKYFPKTKLYNIITISHNYHGAQVKQVGLQYRKSVDI